MIKKDVVKRTGLSNYMISVLSKQLGLSKKSGRTKIYSDVDVDKLLRAAHYRKYKKTILKMYKRIKMCPGSTDYELRKYLKISYYQYEIALYELTWVCYLWEEDIKVGNKIVPSYYINGEIFENYRWIFELGKT